MSRQLAHGFAYSLLAFILIITACARPTPSPSPVARAPTASPVTASRTPLPTATTSPVATHSPTHTAISTTTVTATLPPTSTASATPTSTATVTPSTTPTPSATATPDPYAGLTIFDLAAREYGGGELTVEENLAVTDAFTRSLVTYPSDGLTIYGFMNVPSGDGPFPVVLVLHGYIDPARYNTLAYTTRYADALARAGYLVIHPNLRDYPPSDDGPNAFRIGYALDALNLIALVKQQGGHPGPLHKADPEAIGLWGHSMGGGITLRTITVSRDVKAAVLYGSMSGDEKKNHERILVWSGGLRGGDELAVPDEDLQRISPIFHLGQITSAVSIHHGEADGTVPLEWSSDLCRRLEGLAKAVECFTYPGQPHTFQGAGDQLFIRRVIDFFNRILKNQT